MKKEITRRDLIGRAGLALGGAVALGALACDRAETAPGDCPPPSTGPTVADFPYAKHLAAGYALDAAAVREAAYHAYYAGGCCHGAYSALLGHLAQTAGAPFDLLPIDFGKFGGGGIAGYGSICGAVLGGILVTNMIVENPTEAVPPATAPQDVRAGIVTELFRWYEAFAFPAYVPQAVDAKERDASGNPLTKLDFSAANLASLQVVPGSHLCHASVTGWCTARGVSAKGADKLARCSRLTADVAGKTAELLNAYLASDRKTFLGTAPNGAAACTSCHSAASEVTAAGIAPPVASGMTCTSCHPTQASPHS